MRDVKKHQRKLLTCLISMAPSFTNHSPWVPSYYTSQQYLIPLVLARYTLINHSTRTANCCLWRMVARDSWLSISLHMDFVPTKKKDQPFNQIFSCLKRREILISCLKIQICFCFAWNFTDFPV